MTRQNEYLVNFIKTTLDDDHGISANAYNWLTSYYERLKEDSELEKELRDIMNKIVANDGRYYVKEGSFLEL